MKTIGILNGPNLNRLGTREPEKYGSQTLADLESLLNKHAAELDAKLAFFQSNHEGEIIDRVQLWEGEGIKDLIINPAALTHTSVALRDAIVGAQMRAVEVHITNVYARESFRHVSMTAPICEAVISGLGFEGYLAALKFLLK